jgi:hypothetical protein
LRKEISLDKCMLNSELCYSYLWLRPIFLCFFPWGWHICFGPIITRIVFERYSLRGFISLSLSQDLYIWIQYILIHFPHTYIYVLASIIFVLRNINIMAYFKKVILNLALLFVIMLSMKVATMARVPLWEIEPHRKTCK